MKRPEFVRTSLNIPRRLHRQLHEAAARRGCSARQMLLEPIEQAVAESPRRPRRRLSLEPPIVRSTGKPIDLSNAEIYELIEFP